MFNLKKSQYGVLLSTFAFIFFLVICTLSVAAGENYNNTAHDPNMIMSISSLESVNLPFDPNDYTFLIYDPNGGEDSIEEAMQHLGIPYDRRGPGQGYEVTANDLATHDILIIGWNAYGDTSGLDSEILAQGITGRTILSGHDLDFHTAPPDPGWYRQAAEKMLIQAIDYVLQAGGTGLITLGCSDGFSYLPTEWGVMADANEGGEDVNEFTQQGLASGVYDGLEPNDFDNWYTSYHDTFIVEPASDFVVFERGGYGGTDNITVARTHCAIIPPDCEVTLSKTDDIGDGNCVDPSIAGFVNSYIGYTISYSTTCDINDVNIIDYLSDYVTLDSCTGGGAYHPNVHAVKWNLGWLDANESGSFTLKVRVAENAPQGHAVTNTVKMYTGAYVIKTDTIYTEVCCLDNPIYVDIDANDGGDGLTWATAFNDLQYAIDYAAAEECYDTVYVAAGTYKAVNDIGVPAWYDYSFHLADGVALFGHFAGTENNPSQRQLSNPAFATILYGERPPDNHVDKVVTADGITDTLLDGFTITGAGQGCACYSKSLSSRAKAVLGFTPQAFDHAINSVISTRLLAISQLCT